MASVTCVTGGTGFVGRHLVRHLIERGDHERVLTRRPEFVHRLWPTDRVEPWKGDLTDPETLRGFSSVTSVVYHLAGENRDPRRLEMANVTGTKNLLEACSDQNLKKFIHLSSMSAMGSVSALDVDETTPCHPESAYERSKHAGEQMALSAVKTHGVPVTVVRPTSVFGEEPTQENDRWAVWFNTIQKGWFRFVGTGDSVANYVYVGDVVGACLLLAESDGTTGEVYIVSDSCPLRDFVYAATDFLGASPPGTLPTGLAYTLAMGFEVMGRLGRFSPPLTLSRVRALTNRVLYSSDKLRQRVGFRPAVGWREGLRRTVTWYQQNGLLPMTRSE